MLADKAFTTVLTRQEFPEVLRQSEPEAHISRSNIFFACRRRGAELF